MLTASGWAVQGYNQIALGAARGWPSGSSRWPPATGERITCFSWTGRRLVLSRPRKPGPTLTGVEWQSQKYALGLPPEMDAWGSPLPFVYESTGIETTFTNVLDPESATRRVFSFHSARRWPTSSNGSMILSGDLGTPPSGRGYCKCRP